MDVLRFMSYHVATLCPIVCWGPMLHHDFAPRNRSKLVGKILKNWHFAYHKHQHDPHNCWTPCIYWLLQSSNLSHVPQLMCASFLMSAIQFCLSIIQSIAQWNVLPERTSMAYWYIRCASFMPRVPQPFISATPLLQSFSTKALCFNLSWVSHPRSIIHSFIHVGHEWNTPMKCTNEMHQYMRILLLC